MSATHTKYVFHIVRVECASNMQELGQIQYSENEIAVDVGGSPQIN